MKTSLLNIALVSLLLVGCRAGPVPEQDFLGGQCDSRDDCTEIHFGEDDDGNIEITPNPEPVDPAITPVSPDQPDDPFEGELPPNNDTGEPVTDDLNPDRPPNSVSGEFGGQTPPAENNFPPLGNVFEGIGDGATQLGKQAKKAAFALSGQASKRERQARQKAEDISRKAKQAELIGEQIKIYQEEIGQVGGSINGKIEKLKSDDFASSQDVQDIVNNLGQSHNKTVESVADSIPEIEAEPEDTEDEENLCQLKLKSCDDITPEDEKVIRGRDYIDYAKDRTKDYEGAQKEGADRLIKTADVAVDEAEKAYSGGDMELGDTLVTMGLGFADGAIGFIPGVGWANDVVQAVSGMNFITGEKLDTFDRSFAVLGVLSGGVLSKVGKGIKALRRLNKVTGTIDNQDGFRKALAKGNSYFEAGLDKNTAQDILDLAGDCLVDNTLNKPINIINSILGLIEDTAYANANKPCGKVLDEVVESAKNIGWNADDIKRFARGARDVTRHGPLSAGRMHEIPVGTGTLADTFRSSSYFSYKNTETLSLYRVQGKTLDEGDRLGRFWTRDKPTGPVQSIVDSALDPTWGNTGTHWVRIDVPAGTTMHEGVAAAQRGLVGGGNQIVLEKIPTEWVKEQGKF